MKIGEKEAKYVPPTWLGQEMVVLWGLIWNLIKRHKRDAFLNKSHIWASGSPNHDIITKWVHFAAFCKCSHRLARKPLNDTL